MDGVEHNDIKLGAAFIFNRDVAWMKESDVVVADINTPSIGVGYELRLAEALGRRYDVSTT